MLRFRVLPVLRDILPCPLLSASQKASHLDSRCLFVGHGQLHQHCDKACHASMLTAKLKAPLHTNNQSIDPEASGQ